MKSCQDAKASASYSGPPTGAAGAVLRFFPAEGRWTVHPLPTRGALVRHMELDADGGAWVAYGNSPAVDPKVARIEVLD